ncbi:MAG: phosphopentomutase [Candidatus Gastranaerophilales bacterium]|nr:phosphopentomutase [Candidatus Gastranaerophilales bacterium]
MKRAIIIVIDSLGIGAAEDCAEFNDVKTCNTICNVANFVDGLNMPNFERFGLGNLAAIEGINKTSKPTASVGIMKEISKGKCTTTGHWEMAGLVLEKPFKTYPNGFDRQIVDEFINQTKCGGILGNYPASGTKIIEDLNEAHQKTKFPIVYTSADSVFQIAVDVDVVPIETLYEWCQIARNILVDEYNVSRVIARPYKIINGKPSRISSLRRDFSVEPFKDTLLDDVLKNNGKVIGIGKIEDIFVKKGLSHAIHTGSNKEGLELTLKALNNELDLDKICITKSDYRNCDIELIFTNLVDTDMLFGHRNDAKGYANALNEIDTYIPKILSSLKDDDLLIITGDHGCDPTVEGTDHTRENVPIVIYNKNKEPKDLGMIFGFDFVAKTIKNWLNIA